MSGIAAIFHPHKKRLLISNSAIREVPDHQEVYLDANGLTSIIFDITERVTPDQAPTDEDALKYHFSDIISGTTDTTKYWHGGTAVLTKLTYVT
jgi:ABC-type uncharacterized transport system involved in gliding motility auxiliary subunit